MEKKFFLGKWFILTGIFTLLATYIINNQTMAAPDNDIQVRISKITNDENEKPGTARMILLDEDNNLIKEFDVETNEGYTSLENINPGKYKLKEIKTPDGYAFSPDQLITIEQTDEIQTFEFLNEKSDAIKLTIFNRDIALNTLVDKSRIQIMDSDNNVIETCDTTTYSPCIFQDLPIGTYTIKETNTPPGYISMVDKTLSVTESDAGKTIEIEEIRDFTKLEICKIDTSDSKQLSGAVFELYNSDGTLYDKWTTDEYVKYIERIPVGTYTLKEVSPPPGYESKDEEHIITVEESKEIVYINAYNSPTIPVENLAVNESIFYIIGAFLLLLGAIVVLISYRQNYKK